MFIEKGILNLEEIGLAGSDKPLALTISTQKPKMFKCPNCFTNNYGSVFIEGTDLFTVCGHCGVIVTQGKETEIEHLQTDPSSNSI